MSEGIKAVYKLTHDAKHTPGVGICEVEMQGTFKSMFLFSHSLMWHAYAVAIAYHRSEVTYKDEGILLLFATSHEAHDAVVRIVDVNPGETGRVSVQLAQSWFSLVEKIQVAHKITQLGMMGVAW